MKTLARIFTAALAFAVGFPAARAEDPYPLRASLFPAPTTPQPGAQHGYSVAVDGDYVVVGAPSTDVSAGPRRGAATVYHATTGALVTSLNHPATGVGYAFGFSVAVSGSRVVVGASDAAYVYDLGSATPTTPMAVLDNPSAVASDSFGLAVAISGNRVVVGAYQADTGAEDAGAAYVYDLASPTPTVPVATLDNPSPNANDRFGAAVAVSGNRVVVGAYFDVFAGAAHVYDLGSVTPTVPVATLHNPDPSYEDLFGYSVAVSGNRVVVGEVRDDTAGTDAGAAHVYDLGSQTPTVPVTTLHSPSPADHNRFGISLALAGDRLVVGEYAGAGVAHVYDLGNAMPPLLAVTLQHPSPGQHGQFGHSVAVSGNRVVVGQVGAESDDDGPIDAGSAYLYDLGNATPTSPVARLNNPAPTTDDEFGASVAVSGDLVVVGARADDSGAMNAGAAYVFDQGSATPRVPVAILHRPTPGSGDSFGTSVAVSGDRAVVGAPYGLFGAAGAAYVYDLGSAAPTVPIATLHNPSPADYDSFGASVAVSGQLVVVGAQYVAGAGAAYVFDLGSATPTAPVAILNNPSPATFDLFGQSVAISGTRVVVGAMNDDTGASDAGSTYVYDLASATPAVPVAVLNNPSPGGYENFGASVAVSGNRVVVGAQSDNTGAAGAGSAYVYDLGSATPEVPVATLNNPSPGTYESFGASVAVSGNRVVVGVINEDSGDADAGSAYVYDLDSAMPTVPVATLNNPSPANGDHFGVSVAVSGNRVVVGASYDDTLNTDEGAAYVFTGPALTRLQDWRLTHFDNPESNGSGADTNDVEHDGVINLLEFATHRDPAIPDGAIGALSKNSDILEFTYQRAKAAALDGLGFFVEWSDSLTPGTWSSADVDESILSDDGTVQEVLATIPAGSAGQRFVRLRVSTPQQR